MIDMDVHYKILLVSLTNLCYENVQETAFVLAFGHLSF